MSPFCKEDDDSFSFFSLYVDLIYYIFFPCSNWIIHRDLKPSNILVWLCPRYPCMWLLFLLLYVDIWVQIYLSAFDYWTIFFNELSMTRLWVKGRNMELLKLLTLDLQGYIKPLWSRYQKMGYEHPFHCHPPVLYLSSGHLRNLHVYSSRNYGILRILEAEILAIIWYRQKEYIKGLYYFIFLL